MAKQTFTLNDFSGGANGYVDPLDIADNELAICQGFKAEPGTVIVLGDMKPVDASNGSYTIGSGDEEASATDLDIESGYGLFTFSHDYNMAGGATDAGTDVTLADTDYFVMMARSSGDSHNKIDIYDTTAHTWRADMIDLGGSSSDARMSSIKPCFFIADGSLRVSPGNFTPVDSGGDLADSTDGSIEINTNYGGYVTKSSDSSINATTDANFHTDIAAGDTIIAGGQEMVALITASTALNAARNMTGLFPSAVDATSGGADQDDVSVIPDTRWRGVVKRKNFPQAGIRGTFIEWYSSYAHPRPPVIWHADLDAGTVNTQYTMPFLVGSGTGDAIITGAQPPMLWIVYKEDNADTDATWDGAKINLYCTALYDDAKQESQPNKVAAAVTVDAANTLGVGIVVNYADADLASGAYQINKRVTGARLYYEDTTNDPGILFQLLEIDFEHGCKKAEAESFSAWVEQTAGSIDDEVVQCPSASSHDQSGLDGTTDAFMFPDPPKAFTYEINTLYPPDVNTHARYKTAVVANRRLFVGNVYQSGKANGDRMLSSPVNKFDILPEYGDFVIDVTQGDGDEIVKLEAYADRLLQFKKRTLYIINIGGGLGEEFLESQHRNMGVENPSQTCMTEYGVAWVNSHGVFLYDGQEITDLTLNKLQMTNTTTRSRALNITESNAPTIGYHPDNKWLVIHAQSAITDANDVEAWIHDFKNGSWTYSQEFTTTDYYKTNMIWTGDNNLVFATGTNAAKPLFVNYRDAGTATPAAQALILRTKDFHLDAPGVKKKLKSVYVTYSANGSTEIQAHVLYQKASAKATEDSQMEEADGGITYYTEADGFKTTGNDVYTVELKPSTAVTDALSFQFQLYNEDAVALATGNFKLYNVSFVYRPLGTR